MPLHRNADGTTVSIPWPTPASSGVKIHTRLVDTEAVAEADEGETVDAATGWAAKAETKGTVKTDTFRRVGKIVDEADFVNQGSGALDWLSGSLGGGLSTLIGGDDGEVDPEDEGWSDDGPAWINELPNALKRFLIQQV